MNSHVKKRTMVKIITGVIMKVHFHISSLLNYLEVV